MTTVEVREVGKNLYYKEILALSSETKPTLANTPSGQKFVLTDNSIIVEMDTGDSYYYKSSTDSWAKLGG